MTRRLTGLRTALLDALVEGPPAAPSDRWFNDDLWNLDRNRLLVERTQLRLRLSLEDLRSRDLWPTCWFVQRLQRVEQILRGRC